MPANNSQFPWSGQQPLDPAIGYTRGYACTPSDTVNGPFVGLNMIASGAGDVALVLMDGVTVIVVAIAAKAPLPVSIAFLRVNFTATTATGITVLQ